MLLQVDCIIYAISIYAIRCDFNLCEIYAISSGAYCIRVKKIAGARAGAEFVVHYGCACSRGHRCSNSTCRFTQWSWNSSLPASLKAVQTMPPLGTGQPEGGTDYNWLHSRCCRALSIWSGLLPCLKHSVCLQLPFQPSCRSQSTNGTFCQDLLCLARQVMGDPRVERTKKGEVRR